MTAVASLAIAGGACGVDVTDDAVSTVASASSRTSSASSPVAVPSATSVGAASSAAISASSTLPPAPTLIITTSAAPYVELEPNVYAIDFDHPTWGPSRLIARMQGAASPGPSSVQVLDAENRVQFEHVWTDLDHLGPLGTLEGDPSLRPVDANGTIFLDFFAGNDSGLLALVPTVDGIDGADLLGDHLVPAGVWDANAIDDDGDGVYEIEQFENDCVPSCAQGTEARTVYRWDGERFAPDQEIVASPVMGGFPFPSFHEVPQLGHEPVRGSGCGADGSLGEVIPDGWWFGYVSVGEAVVAIDLYCVYYGESAQPFFEECVATAVEPEVDCNHGITSFWPVNGTTRERVMPVSADVVIDTDVSGCWTMGNSAVVHIAGGRVDHIRYECAHS